MKCVICHQSKTMPGHTTVTLERDGVTFVIEHVPVQVCLHCGEAYVDEEVIARLLEDDEMIASSGRDQGAVLTNIRRRRHFDPASVGAPDSLTLLREDRER